MLPRLISADSCLQKNQVEASCDLIQIDSKADTHAKKSMNHCKINWF